MTQQQIDAKPLAVITGASTGIGFELARVFGENGYDLIINSDSDKIIDSANELRGQGHEVQEVKADLATREGVDELYESISTSGRAVDVLVLNAGVAVGGEFLKNDFESELNSMNLNMVYLVYLAKKVLQDMTARNEGKVLFTSSIAAEMPGPYYAVYAATKSFVQSFAEAIRYELKDAHKNITITSLQPGPTDTNFFERGGLVDTEAGQKEKDDPAEVARQGFEALMDGEDHVVAGSFMNKVQAAGSKFMTEEMRAASHAKQIKPNSLERH
jgi:short-subunit dehydrogenase